MHRASAGICVRSCDTSRCGGCAGTPDAYVPTPLQQALWLAGQRARSSALLGRTLLLHLHGELDVMALEQALSVLLHKHPVLRSALLPDATSATVVARLQPFAPVFLRAEAIAPLQLVQAAAEVAARPLRLDQRLYRCHLFRLARRWHVLLLGLHPVVADDCSVAIVLQSLAGAYSRLCVDPAWQAKPPDQAFFRYCSERQAAAHCTAQAMQHGASPPLLLQQALLRQSLPVDGNVGLCWSTRQSPLHDHSVGCFIEMMPATAAPSAAACVSRACPDVLLMLQRPQAPPPCWGAPRVRVEELPPHHGVQPLLLASQWELRVMYASELLGDAAVRAAATRMQRFLLQL